MKKEYKKPIALVENFEMDEFIVGACRDAGKDIFDAPTIIGSTINKCTVIEGGFTYFSTQCKVNTFKYDTCYQGILGKYFAS